MNRPMQAIAARRHSGFWAFALHRLSGLALVLFLPLHFLMLGLALDGAAGLDEGLAWTASPLAKVAETGLVVLLALHLLGGLRLMAWEWAPARGRDRRLIAGAAALAILIGAAFALRIVHG